MKCPFCNENNDRVVDSRESKEGEVIRRRRECNACSRRFTSYETIDQIDYMVIKRDGRREPFARQKVLAGLIMACKKRTVSIPDLEAIINEIESELHGSPGREMESEEIGNFIMRKLHGIDPVAYVRFASVYRDFRDINDLKSEVDKLFSDPK
jgi:transcriptional repressor NrdR